MCTRTNLPQYDQSVVVPRRHPLSVPAACDAPDACGVSLVLHAQGVWERFELPRPRKSGHQRLRRQFRQYQRLVGLSLDHEPPW